MLRVAIAVHTSEGPQARRMTHNIPGSEQNNKPPQSDRASAPNVNECSACATQREVVKLADCLQY